MTSILPHLIRPYFIYALPLLLLSFFFIFKSHILVSFWQRYLPQKYQDQLLNTKQLKRSTLLPKLLLILFMTCGFCALLGPSWVEKEVMTQQQVAPLSIVMDLSSKMNQPNHNDESSLTLAKHKIQDILDERGTDPTELIVYSGTAHTVVPMTNDHKTIKNMLSAVETKVMPKAGAIAIDGITLALRSLLIENNIKNAPSKVKGSILLMTTGLESSQIRQINQLLAPYSQVKLFILGIDIAKDSNQETALSKLAKDHHGIYAPMTLNDQDLKQFNFGGNSIQKQSNDQIKHYIDQGYWFILPMILCAFYFMRRSFIFCLPFVFLLNVPKTEAAFYDSLLYNQNQLAQHAIQNGNYEAGLEKISDPNWQAFAQYQLSDYQQAEDFYKTETTAEGIYNYGNALARQQKYQEALDAWHKALELRPDFPEAIKNIELVEELLKQQQEQEQQNQENQQDDENQNNENQDQNENQQNGQDKNDSQRNDQQDDKNNSSKEKDESEQSQDHSNENQKNEENEQTDETNEQNNANNEEGEESAEDDNAPDEQQKALEEALAEQKEQEKAQAQQMQENEQPSDEDINQQEKEAYLQQLLDGIPDQPENSSNFLRNKFHYEYQRGNR